MPNSPLVSCATVARVSLRTIPKPCAGTDWLPIRATSLRSTTSGSCTTTGWACRKTMPKPCVGSESPPTRATAERRIVWRPNRVTPPPRFPSGASYANGEGVAQDLVEAVKWYRLAAEQGHAPGAVGPRVFHVRVWRWRPQRC